MKKMPIFCVAVLGAMLSACSGNKGNEESLPVVRIDTIRSTGGEGELQYPGRVVASSETKLSFKLAGTLRRVYVGEGDRVSAGQLVAELDATDYQIQLNATKAEYAQIKADAERVIELYKEGGTTASNYDKARYGLEQITAKLQNHTNQMKYTKIYAPSSGFVSKKYFDNNETVSAGMPIVSIVGTGSPEVEINLPAASYAHRDKFSRYTCMLDVLPGEVIPLQMISILPQANANQLYTMRLKLPSAGKQIAPGMSAWVTIQTSDTTAMEVVVPTTSLVNEKGKTFLFTYNAKTQGVKRIDVEVQRLHTDGTAVVLGDIRHGDLVVSSGAHHIQDGQKVKQLAPISSTNVGGLL